MRLVSASDPEYPEPKHNHLWLLVGGEDYYDGSTAYYLGFDRDIDGDDCASERIYELALGHGFDAEEAKRALAWYRS